jgi:hypothetical protein
MNGHYQYYQIGLTGKSGSAISNRRKPKICFTQVFNSKMGSFVMLHSKHTAYIKPLLELKTWPRFSLVSLSMGKCREYLRGKYHCTVALLFWLVWNQLYDKWQFLFLFLKHTNPNQSNRWSNVQWYPPLVFPSNCYQVLIKSATRWGGGFV